MARRVWERRREPGSVTLGEGAGLINNLAPSASRARAPRESRVSPPRVRRAAGGAGPPLPHATVPGDTDPPTPYRPRKPHTDPQGSEHIARCGSAGSAGAESRARLPSPALPSSTSPVPKPRGSRTPGGAGGGAGCREALAQKAESGGAGARSVSAVPTAPRRKPSENPDPDEVLVHARPGQAPRYGVLLGPSLGSLLQSGRCRPSHRLLEQFKPQVSPESPPTRASGLTVLTSP